MKTNKILSRIIKDIMKCIKKNQCSVSPHTHRFYIVDIILNMSGYGNLGQLTSFLDYVIIFFLELNMNEKVFGEKEKASKRNIDRSKYSTPTPRVYHFNDIKTPVRQYNQRIKKNCESIL